MIRPLTELEQCVVGVVWRDGPMTTYEIAATFTSSLSTYWSGSAGAIYPLVKRLCRRGLLRSHSRARGSRVTLISATPAGKSALRAWLAPPLPESAGAPSFDPVRTRLYFIEILPSAQRLRFIDAAEAVIREQMTAIQERRAEDLAAGRAGEALGGVGAIYELQSRLRWLRDVRKFLGAGKKMGKGNLVRRAHMTTATARPTSS